MKRGQIQLRGRVRWKARRFRSTLKYGPRALRSLPVVFGNAIPKSGSKLLFNVLRGLTDLGPFVDSGLNPIKPYDVHGDPTSSEWIRRQLDALRPGDLRFGYLYATPENVKSACRPGWANFLIIRDPRDLIVSEIFYAMHLNPGHQLHEHLHSLKDMEARVEALVRGIPEGPLSRVDVRGHYERFLGWLDRPEVVTLKFEDLVTNRAVQLTRVLDHLMSFGFHPQESRQQALQVLSAGMAPERSTTFRKGKSGEWREHFSARNKDLFKQVAGDLLVQLGYETDLNW